MKKNLILFLTIIMMFFSYVSCAQKANDDIETMASWMIGSFDSKEQSIADTNFLNINLEMVRIWEDRNDGIWLYVEQAASWALEKPYRQRVYRLSSGQNGKIISEVFTLNNPMQFAGAFNEEKPLNALTPDSLKVREGCAIVIEKKGELFEGSTSGKECRSNLRGASYATSEVRIEREVLTSWDRGFNEKNIQVWGAETGPYIFKKKHSKK